MAILHIGQNSAVNATYVKSFSEIEPTVQTRETFLPVSSSNTIVTKHRTKEDAQHTQNGNHSDVDRDKVDDMHRYNSHVVNFLQLSTTVPEELEKSAQTQA